MIKKPTRHHPQQLRDAAEAELARAPQMQTPALANEELLHELRVHQIELEMQNEALRQAQIAMEESRDRYVDLYDFAPIGYLTLSREGMISEINLTGATLLGAVRKSLLRRRFSLFVITEDRDRWDRFFIDGFQHDAQQSCELVIKRGDDTLFHARLDCLRTMIRNETSMRVAFSDVTGSYEAAAEIQRLAYYDPLTQLPNRRLLLDRLGQALSSSKRRLHHGAILFMDLDNFKALNDARGHDIGDLLLIAMAQRLHGAVREGDTIARLGGDEFVILLENLSVNAEEAVIQVGLVGEKVQEIVSSAYMLKDIEYSCTTSIGITLFCNADESADDLMQHADHAMYQAKKGGGNSLRFFDDVMQAALEKRNTLEKDLRQALAKHQLRLHYQIQVDHQHRPLGAEVLLRWDHPERGLVTPQQFLALAEETGLIVPIGLWELQAACAQLKTWQNDVLTRDLTLAVNVSAKQFHQDDFVAQVQLTLQDCGADSSRLKLELTESIVLENIEETINKMHELKQLGISLSLDDFGTRFSSLSSMKRLPLDQIKIDCSFVHGICTDPGDAAIVQTTIAMANALNLNVIAEGVETGEQRAFLELHGCHAFQGMLFSEPVPMEEFNLLLVSANKSLPV